MYTQIVTAQRTSSHERRVLNAPRTHLRHLQRSGGTGSPVGHLAGDMPPEMQPPASAWGQEVIMISVFVLVKGRKRRDSNPRVVAHRSLSRRMGIVCWSVCLAVYLLVFF